MQLYQEPTDPRWQGRLDGNICGGLYKSLLGSVELLSTLAHTRMRV